MLDGLLLLWSSALVVSMALAVVYGCIYVVNRALRNHRLRPCSLLWYLSLMSCRMGRRDV